MRIRTKLVGTTWTDPDGSLRQKGVHGACRGAGTRLAAYAEPLGERGPKSISVWIGDQRLGYLRKEVSVSLWRYLKKGGALDVRVFDLTGGDDEKPYSGVVVEIQTLPRPRQLVVAEYVEGLSVLLGVVGFSLCVSTAFAFFIATGGEAARKILMIEGFSLLVIWVVVGAVTALYKGEKFRPKLHERRLVTEPVPPRVRDETPVVCDEGLPGN